MLKSQILICSFLILGLFGRGQEWVKYGKSDNGGPTDALFADTVDNLLYVGGSFNRFDDTNPDPGSVTASSIATWDGTHWDTLGNGTNCQGLQCPRVFEIIRYQDKIYACGDFNQMGNVNASIAAWNGLQWEFVANTPNGIISGFNVIDDELYIMGSFTQFEGLNVNGIVKYDGTNFADVHGFGQIAFTEFSTVADIEFYNEMIYISGRFTGSEGKTHICRYDGGQWVSVGGGVDEGEGFLIIDLITYKDELYACGRFEKINGIDYGNSIARWNGFDWNSVGGGTSLTNYEMTVWQDRLVVVQGAALALATAHFSIWDGAQWCSIDVRNNESQKITASVSTVTTFQDTLYIGGGFTLFDEDNGIRSIIAKFDGDVSDWDTCGTYVVGLDEGLADQQNSIRLFPNPATDLVRIESPEHILYVSIYDIHGKKVGYLESNHSTVELDVRKWSAGVYSVVIQNEDGIEAKLLMKE